MKSDLLRVICCCICGVAPLSGQKQSDEGGVRFRTFGWMVSAEELYYDVNGRDTRISIIDSARSVFFHAPKAGQIVFYRLVPGPKEKPEREEAATVDVSAAGKWPLLIFMKSPESPKRYCVAAVADDLEAFPFPSCRFINFTAADLSVTYGDQQVKVAARGIERLDPRLKPGAGTETRYATVSANTPQGPRLLYGNNWAVRPAQRTLVLVFSQDERLQVLRVTDDIALYTTPVAK